MAKLQFSSESVSVGRVKAQQAVVTACGGGPDRHQPAVKKQETRERVTVNWSLIKPEKGPTSLGLLDQ